MQDMSICCTCVFLYSR